MEDSPQYGMIPYMGEDNAPVEAFQKFLNANPDKQEVKTNSMANNSQYISIATVERKLDELYSGLWQTDNFRWSVVANEIVGAIDLKVFHPVAKCWITRTGAASALIQTAKDKPATVENKIKNTLVKDMPHLKAECLKNAAKSLGTVFGRNLNRGAEDDFMYLSETVREVVDGTATALRLLETSTVTAEHYTQIERKIERATPKTIKAIIDYLSKNQQQ